MNTIQIPYATEGSNGHIDLFDADPVLAHLVGSLDEENTPDLQAHYWGDVSESGIVDIMATLTPVERVRLLGIPLWQRPTGPAEVSYLLRYDLREHVIVGTISGSYRSGNYQEIFERVNERIREVAGEQFSPR